MRYPGIQGGATRWDDGFGLTWTASKAILGIKLYDKCKEMRGAGTRSVLRAEVSIRGRKVIAMLPGNSWQEFSLVYYVYREILCRLPEIKMPGPVSNIYEAIGGESRETRERILSRLAHKPDRTFRRIRAKIEAGAGDVDENFNWSLILPCDGPPPAFDVLNKRDVRRLATSCHHIHPEHSDVSAPAH